jgi:hypothetical protein
LFITIFQYMYCNTQLQKYILLHTIKNQVKMLTLLPTKTRKNYKIY